MNTQCKKTGRFEVFDLSGQRFYKLTVIRQAGRSKHGHVNWECVCDCGNKTIRRGDYLVKMSNQSCGCLAREISREVRRRLQTTHGISRTPTGRSWMAMMTRCFNSKSKDFERYGAIGRTACEHIRASPITIVELIGERPPGKSLDRTDNRGFYTCGKCPECSRNGWSLNIRWATPKEQANNK